MFGDSAAITGYLRWLDYRLKNVEQTKSSRKKTSAMALHHEVPALSEVGRGTMVSDGLSLLNADFSSSSFRVRPVAVGERNFIGNNIAYPAGARLGANCLVATKAMVPLTGPVRQDTGTARLALLRDPPHRRRRSSKGNSLARSPTGRGAAASSP